MVASTFSVWFYQLRQLGASVVVAETSVQQFTGKLGHQARTTRLDILHAVTDIAMTQAAPTTDTMADVDQLANYLVRHPKAYVEYKATDMTLRCHYDSSLKPAARHKAGFILYDANKDEKPETVRSVTEVVSKTPSDRVASIAEGKYHSQFLSGQRGYYHGVVLEAMGYPQTVIALYGDNTTAIGIASDTSERY